ncbi:MAG TPA: DUF3313 family protein [Casimicrobiaceae bacterium]|nr:DUF3313 family protein [Casimicrobiaceae bacterium]
MNARSLFALCTVLLLGVAAPSEAADAATSDGLVAVHSWNLDELYLRPNADLGAYRSVIIDPAQVSFRPDWNRDFVDPHASLRRLSQDDVRRITDETAAGLQSALADAFKGRGYAIATAPGPGVLRVSPTLSNVYVNAVEDMYTGGTTKSFTKDAGEATLLLDVRDAATGALLARVVDRRTAQEAKGTQINQRGDVVRGPRVTTNFWFEDLFRKWSVACVKELEGSKKS